jgi:hypothetical protein
VYLSTVTRAERSGISDTEQFPIYRELATALMKNAENTVWTVGPVVVGGLVHGAYALPPTPEG